MKHLLILFLTFAGIVLAATGKDFNTELKKQLDECGYTPGCKFHISFSLSDLPLNKSAMKVTDNCYIVNEAHRFWGLNSDTTNRISPAKGWSHKMKDDKKHVYITEPKIIPQLWVQNHEGNNRGYRHTGAHINVEIKCNGKSSVIKLSYAGTDFSDTIVLKDTALDAGEFRVNPGATVTNPKITAEGNTILGFAPTTLGAIVLGAAALLCLFVMAVKR